MGFLILAVFVLLLCFLAIGALELLVSLVKLIIYTVLLLKAAAELGINKTMERIYPDE